MLLKVQPTHPLSPTTPFLFSLLLVCFFICYCCQRQRFFSSTIIFVFFFLLLRLLCSRPPTHDDRRWFYQSYFHMFLVVIIVVVTTLFVAFFSPSHVCLFVFLCFFFLSLHHVFEPPLSTNDRNARQQIGESTTTNERTKTKILYFFLRFRSLR